VKPKSAIIRSPTSSRRRCLARVALLLALAFAGLVLVAFNFAYDWLSIETGPRHGEVIVVLGGESAGRAQEALELFKAGAARSVIVSGDGVDNPIQERLVRGGVPRDAIVLEAKSRNTKENAEFTTRLLKQRGVHHAIIVTSWFHSRRAMNCFYSFAPEIQFSSVPCTSFNGLRAEGTHVMQEYVKTVWYSFRYGIPPWRASAL
jgi:uncharacterized SAM-binding protein YcdF (DUF218 family)